MRIKELKLRGWRVLNHADFLNLSDFVVIAGPNGVGKTKVKDAIVHIFQNQGNPPPDSSVVLEATNEEERDAWGRDEFSLPQSAFMSIFGRNSKRIKTRSKVIQIDSNRNIDSVQFQQLTFNDIGNPEEEEIGFNYGIDNIRGRFLDICRTLHRIKSKEVTSVYNEYKQQASGALDTVTFQKLQDPTQKYLDTFDMLLYPKKMLPIDIKQLTIQYLDDDGITREFNELSSGEREVVILTFDVLAQDPDDCLILIDEPEVHLHPELTFRLVKVLKSIGKRNQIFLFTHSADIIGNSFDTGIHFIRPKVRVSGNQVIRIDENNIEDFNAIPNIRETIGMVSVGKKLLFVEGGSTSIDRNIFATIAKASKIDVAIIPSNSCSNINNMALMCETLQRGILGVDIYMVRDRDGLTQEQVNTFSEKSKGKLMFLPYYHIENAFLDPTAIGVIARKILGARAPEDREIEAKMVALARQQLNDVIALYLKNEIYFEAGNFDVSPRITLTAKTSIEEIRDGINQRRIAQINQYETSFSEAVIDKRLREWKQKLEESLNNGWSSDARKYFIGKRILKELSAWLFRSNRILIWEHIIDSEDESCQQVCSELRSILNSI